MDLKGGEGRRRKGMKDIYVWFKREERNGGEILVYPFVIFFFSISPYNVMISSF
jgi:hypothetical protein